MEKLGALDERLSAIAAQVPSCDCVADIGADHGRLGAYLLLAGKCQRVQMLDVSEDSLAKARKLVRRLHLTERVRFGVGDGAAALREKADCAVIAGMGGPTIAGIVSRGREALKDAFLVMQPNMAIEALRQELARSGFRIVDEVLARAAGRWYVIICARGGEASYDEREVVAGPVLMRRRPPELAGYAAFRLRVAEKALRGARQGDGTAARKLTWEVKLWREILDGCNGGDDLSPD